KGKGVVSEGGQEVTFTMEGSIKSFEQVKIDAEVDVNGMKMNATIVINGDKAWIKHMDMVMDAPAEALPSIKQVLYAIRLTHKLPALKEKVFTLSPLGEAKVNERAADGIKIEHKDRKGLSLYF